MRLASGDSGNTGKIDNQQNIFGSAAPTLRGNGPRLTTLS
jgi:hypothetical protein